MVLPSVVTFVVLVVKSWSLVVCVFPREMGVTLVGALELGCSAPEKGLANSPLHAGLLEGSTARLSMEVAQELRGILPMSDCTLRAASGPGEAIPLAMGGKRVFCPHVTAGPS